MDQRVKESEVKYPKDLEEFGDFQKLWRDGTLPKNHIVMVKVKRWAKSIAYKYQETSRADDLEQDCLMALSDSGYNGAAKLDTFIVKILLSKNIATWRKNGRDRQTEMPVEMEASSEFSKAVLERVLLDSLMKTQNDLIATIVEIVTEAEHIIGRKRIAELASARLDRNITRHQIEVALEQLRDRLRWRDRLRKRRRVRKIKFSY